MTSYDNVTTVLVTMMTVLFSAGAWKFYEKRINVSDDEKDVLDDDDDDDDVEDDDEEDDDDDDDEEDDDEEDDDDDDDDDDEEDNNVKSFDIKGPVSLNNEFIETIQSSQVYSKTSENNIELVEVSATSNYLNSDEDIFIKNLPIILTNFDEDLGNSSKVITLENNLETTQKVEKKNYSKMRIDDLRTLVVTKNILDNESAQKMKKNDLVKLLQK